ncbi:hypothetical protein Tco_1066901 [Tanacetum coccineum]|uniref:Uncharacterized protein n=1 Tax=Tanacetum coccineum TaxID=301880 RepID=A0ABQ5HCL9_9ASTR
MLAPPVVVDEGSKQPTEPQPTSSTAPQEILHLVATATTSQPPKDPHIFWITKRCQNTKVPQSGGSPKKVGDEAINEKMFDSMEMAITTIASLDATHDKSHTSGNGEGNMEHHFELTDNVPHTPHDSPLSGGNITGSDKGRIELIKDLMETSLTKRVLALEEAKTAQDRVINRLKLRVKRLEKKRKARTPQPMKRRLFKGRVETSTDTSLGEDASKQGRSSDKTKPMFKDSDFDVLDAEQITTTGPSHVSTADQVSTARPEVSAATPSTPPTTTTVFDDEDVTMAMAQTLIKMKEVKAKEKGVEFRNVEEASRPVRSITTLQPLPKIDPKDKGKSVLVEEEPKKVKIRDQGLAQIESDVELAQILHEEELADSNMKREQFTIKEKAQFLVEIIAAQRKFRATQRAAEIKSKPPTKTQLRNLMMTYLNNTGGYKHIHLKGKTYEEIHELYERQQKRNQDFIPIDLEKEAQKSGKRLKRVAGSYTTQKSPKKSKVIKFAKNVTEEEAAEYEKEKEELRLNLKIIFGDDSEVNYEPLSRRFLIVNLEYKLLGSVDTKGMYVYKLTRADESSSYHRDMQAFLRRLE